MKINETKLKKIIQEEMDMIDQPYFDHVDSEGGMAKSQLYKMAKYAMMLHDALQDDTQLEAWVQSKITMASEYISKVKHYLEYEMNMDMIDPEGHDEPEVGGCGSDAPMIVDDTESFEIDDEMMHLMET
jgi:serine protease inhibitor